MICQIRHDVNRRGVGPQTYRRWFQGWAVKGRGETLGNASRAAGGTEWCLPVAALVFNRGYAPKGPTAKGHERQRVRGTAR